VIPAQPAHALERSDDFLKIGAAEAAPARNRVRFLAISLLVMLALLAGRAIQLAFAGDPLAEPHRTAAVASTSRADIVDRNGVLLATTVRAYTLTAAPERVADPVAAADSLRRLFPDLDRDTLIRKLSDADHQLVFLRRSLTPEQRNAVIAMHLRGVDFADEEHRVYPQGTLAAQALGFTDIDLKPLAGVERGLDDAIRAAGEEGRPVRLSLDVRIQYALETELDAAASAAHAAGGGAILLDGRTGETLALASWPSFDPNRPGEFPRDDLRDRVAGDLHELGSTIKPFTVAMALQEGRTSDSEVFDLTQPFDVDGSLISDENVIRGPATLRDIMARSSNIGAARLALRLGEARQTAYLQRLGLLSPAALELARNQAPIAAPISGRRDIAGRGFGYGLAATQAALAGAYTVFVNSGARIGPTLLARASGERIARTQVFSAAVTRQLLAYMRAVVTDGTGRAADVPGLQVAGKTGTAEKLGDDNQSYDQGRNFSSFAGVFPANDPHYVIVLALDETGAGEQGGAVAAPAVARTLRRIAPMLGLAVEPRPATR
jgi:cell division protein FtsI (penicillin-binding protein 3)